MKIPEIRERLRDLAVIHSVPELHDLADALYRRKAIRRAPPRAVRVTPALREEMVTYADTHPDMPFREIGEVFGVDGARVSEAVAGFRE